MPGRSANILLTDAAMLKRLAVAALPYAWYYGSEFLRRRIVALTQHAAS